MKRFAGIEIPNLQSGTGPGARTGVDWTLVVKLRREASQRLSIANSAAVPNTNLDRRLQGRSVIRAVVRRVHDALLPGGEIGLVGEMLDDDRRGPLDAALWGMNEAICHSGGKAHTIGQCLGYFRDAGFTAIRDEVFVPGVLHLVSGVKAG